MEQQSELLEKIIGLGLDNDQISAITDTLDACLNEIERLQAKITEYAALLMDYEEKFDVIAENEGKRMLQFGEALKRQAISWVVRGAPLATIQKDIRQIDLKQLYTNFKRK